MSPTCLWASLHALPRFYEDTAMAVGAD
jgi:hypothetical protein